MRAALLPPALGDLLRRAVAKRDLTRFSTLLACSRDRFRELRSAAFTVDGDRQRVALLRRPSDGGILVGVPRGGAMPPATPKGYASNSQLIGKMARRCGGAVVAACSWLPPVAEQPHMPILPLLQGCAASHSVMS